MPTNTVCFDREVYFYFKESWGNLIHTSCMILLLSAMYESSLYE